MSVCIIGGVVQGEGTFFYLCLFLSVCDFFTRFPITRNLNIVFIRMKHSDKIKNIVDSSCKSEIQVCIVLSLLGVIDAPRNVYSLEMF